MQIRPHLFHKTLTASLVAAACFAGATTEAQFFGNDGSGVQTHNEPWPVAPPPAAEPTEAELKAREAALAAWFEAAAETPADGAAPAGEVPTPVDIEVDLELIMLLDSSQSVSETEYALQRSGYKAAFTDPQVHAAIEDKEGVYVAMIDFSSTNERRILGQAILYDAEDAIEFANLIGGAPRTFSNNTIIAHQIGFADWILDWNRTDDGGFIHADRQVIDISGDGICESFLHFQQQVDAEGNQPSVMDPKYGDSWPLALSRLPSTCTINAISIGDTPGLKEWYADFLAQGPGAFAMHADDFNAFQDAIKVKIIREVNFLEDGFD